jgi:hypothetical protein
MIKDCNCKHKYQDDVYGKNKRVHNQSRSRIGKEKPAWTCTVCGTKKE